jgi:hypothetical protein
MRSTLDVTTNTYAIHEAGSHASELAQLAYDIQQKSEWKALVSNVTMDRVNELISDYGISRGGGHTAEVKVSRGCSLNFRWIIVLDSYDYVVFFM